MRLSRVMLIVGMGAIVSNTQCGLLDWIKKKKQPKIEHRVTEEPPEKLNAAEWLKKFATYDDIDEFNRNSTILAQQIFLGIYPSGWLTDKISLNTLAQDASGMYKRYNQILGTDKENTAGWFLMINNTIFHLDNAVTLQEENDKLKQVEERKQEWAKIKETVRNLRKFKGEQAYNNMKDLVSKYWGQQIHWLFADQKKAAVESNPDSFLAKATKAAEYFTRPEDYKKNFMQPLRDAKQHTITLFNHASSFLSEKQKFSQKYLNLEITPDKIQNNKDKIIQEIRKAASEKDIKNMESTVQKYKSKIDDLASKLETMDAQISRAINEMPQEWQSRSMLVATYKAWLIIINLHKAVQRIQFGARNEHYILEATRKKIQNEKPPEQPAQTQTDYTSYLDYVNPKSWWDYIWGSK